MNSSRSFFPFPKKGKKKEKKGTIKNNRGDETRSKLKIFHGTIISFLSRIYAPVQWSFFPLVGVRKKADGSHNFPRNRSSQWNDVHGTMRNKRLDCNA